MESLDRARQPRGIPAGGQFAGTLNPESDVVLEEPPSLIAERGKVGSKYHLVRDPYHSASEIAGLIRSDIKEAQRNGELPSDLQISVTSQTYAGGRSIDVKVHNFPNYFNEGDDALCIHSPWCTIEPGQVSKHERGCPAYATVSDEAKAVEEKLRELYDAYNYDRSDVMTDYFDVNYYGGVHVEPDWKSLRAPRDLGLEPLRSTGTLAALKREVATGIKLQTVQNDHFEKSEGVIREISKVQSNGFYLRTAAALGRDQARDFDSWVDWGRAADVVYDVDRREFSIQGMRFKIMEGE